jgi:hypothetical protein
MRHELRRFAYTRVAFVRAGLLVAAAVLAVACTDRISLDAPGPSAGGRNAVRAAPQLDPRLDDARGAAHGSSAVDPIAFSAADDLLDRLEAALLAHSVALDTALGQRLEE